VAEPIYNVLFLCTGNSARSIMAEAILDREGKGRFRAYSAGSKATGQVNPRALALLQGLGYEVAGFRSKSWDEFAVPGAPAMDFVFTVCDEAAGETCPIWPGHPATAHWGIADPAKATGTPAEIQLAFDQAYRLLMTRIGVFISLPLDKLDRAALHTHLRDIGAMESDKASSAA
jgi:arsenate reductase (thioredoxin)